MMIRLYGVLLFCWIYKATSQNLMFTIEPKSVVVRKGSPAILNCQTNIQTSDILIQWRKGYKALWIHNYNNQSYQLLGNHSLYFPSVGSHDEDVYFCAAVRQSTSKTIYTKVPAHITLAYINSNFIRPPLPLTIREHQTATLTCISGASQPLPIVTWEKNGRPITKQNSTAQHEMPERNATSATLQLKNVSILADTGYYRCVATNPLLPDEPKKSQPAFLTVWPRDDKPRIEVHPVNKVSPIHKPLRLDCVIVGVPPPVVNWLHNNVRVRNSSNVVVYPNGSLVIKQLTLRDNGQYSCSGTNNKGSVASSNVFLNVAYVDFYFKKNPENQTVVNGSRVEMICEPPNHYPRTLRYKWYKEYKTINVGGGTSISSTGNLIITPVLKDDEGVYFCEVTNELSIQTRTSRTAYLTVNVPPYFLTKPSDQTVVISHTLRLMCKASGSPKPQLMWYYHDLLLSNTSRLTLGADGSLELNWVNINDAGRYKCSVQNVAGNNVAIATVVVHAPPNGTIMPIDTSVVLENNATFLCRFAGNPPPVTIWYFKRTNEGAFRLPSNSSRYIQSHELLKVVNVTEEDNGMFICVGENIVGVQNFSAKLMVLVPARLETFPRNTIVNKSDVAEMTCGGYGKPEPKVTWSMNGSVLSNTSRITLTDGNLRIRNVIRNDTGLYSCTVRNYLRSQTFSAFLTVQVSPTILGILGPSRVQWKRNFSFNCLSDGVPIPWISWLKDMRKISNTERMYAQGSVLYIISAKHNNTGNYTCEASNIVGSTRMTRQLIVEVPPSRPINVRLAKITSTSIQVLWKSGFDGYSPITSYKLDMRRNSSKAWDTISEQIKSENYTVKRLKPYTLYHLRVFAENMIGLSEPSPSIWNRTEEDFPSSPTKLQCQTLNSSAIILSWHEPSQRNGILRKYRIQYGNHGSHALADVTTALMTYYIRKLEPFTWYKFRVQAATGENSFLWGNYSSYVSCQSGEAAPMVAPKNLSLTTLGSQTIMARWQKIPVGSENGIVKGYYIQYKKISEETYAKVFIVGNDTLEYNISGLAPWTVYDVQVAAMTVALGPWSTAMTSRTMQSVPSGRPSNITVKAITSTSLTVNWDPPPMESQNGIILGYMVLYGIASSQLTTKNLTTNETSVELTGLLIYSSYMVKVRAFTAVGFGPYSDGVVSRTLESYPSSITSLTYKITNGSVIISWLPPHTPNGIITAYTTYLNTTTVRIFRRLGTNITVYNVTTQNHEITSRVTQVVLSGFYGNVTYSLCVAARTNVGYGPCSDNIVFTTNFTKKLVSEEEEFTSSIIDDHLPLIAGGAAILFVFVIGVLVCYFIRRRNKKKGEEEAKQTFNFQRHTFPMGSFDDGDSSVASHGSKPINADSVESSSIHSQTNPSINVLASQSESHDGSPYAGLRNNSLALGSDSSSYDAPYSSVAEIGVDPASIATDHVYTAPHAAGKTSRHFVNDLYKERELEDTKRETGSLDSHAALNPIYEPNYPQEPRLESVTSPRENLQGSVEPFSKEGNHPALHSYGVLVLPPPPPEYSDYSEDADEIPYAYSNAVTDF